MIKIPNHNAQIPNNFQIPSSNDENLLAKYSMSSIQHIGFGF